VKTSASLYLICFTFILLFFSGCDKPKRIPSTLPDIRGHITNLKLTSDKKGTVAVVLVESIEGVDTKSSKASIRIDQTTLIRDDNGDVVKLEQLDEGEEIEAWFTDEFDQSLPVETTATAVRVMNK
jgi:hypothetical protein